MTSLPFAFAMTLLLAPSEDHSIPWAKSFAEAREASVKSTKPLLVDFGAEWCGFCKKLDRETFSDEKVIRLVRESFIAVHVDTDKEPELSKKYHIEGLPTIVFFAPGGEELARLEGFRPPEQFLKEAGKPAESSASLQKLKELAEKDPKDLAAQRAYARALFAAANFDGALKALGKALEIAPDDAGLLLDSGDAYRTAGKPKEAREAYEKVLAMRPDAAGESREKVFLPLANVLLSLKEPAAAVKVLDELLKDESRKGNERLEALFLRGYVHSLRKDADRALADLKAARDADPEGRWGQRAGLIIETIEAK